MNKQEIQNLKSRNANIIIIFILFGILCNNVYSQKKINGKFCKEFKIRDYGECFTFESDSTFTFKYSGHLGTIDYGKGSYKMLDKLLILNYDKTEPLKIGHHISKVWTNNSNSIAIHFQIFDFDNIPIPDVNIIYEDSLSKNGYSGIVANNDGIAQLTLTRENKDFHFALSNLGFSKYEFTVDKKYNYSISVYLQKQGNGLPIRNQIDTISINKIRAKYFTVKNKQGKTITWRKAEN